MGAPSFARALADSRLRVCCCLCGAECPAPDDPTLCDVIEIAGLHRDGRAVEFGWGRDGLRALVVFCDGECETYCPAHALARCLRHAAAAFRLHLPEALQ